MRRLAPLVLWLAACSRPVPTDEHAAAPVLEASPLTPVPEASPTRASIYSEPVPELAEARMLCDALHLLPAQRRAACCPDPLAEISADAQAAADVCAAELSAAVAGGGVVLDDTALTTCLEARDQQLAGCAWVGLSPPPRPVPCAAAVHGTLTAQSRCRSHRECAPGLRCADLGPLRPGMCAASTVDATDPVDALARDLRDDVPLATSPAPGRCRSDAECPGSCRRDPAGSGICVARCDP